MDREPIIGKIYYDGKQTIWRNFDGKNYFERSNLSLKGLPFTFQLRTALLVPKMSASYGFHLYDKDTSIMRVLGHGIVLKEVLLFIAQSNL